MKINANDDEILKSLSSLVQNRSVEVAIEHLKSQRKEGALLCFIALYFYKDPVFFHNVLKALPLDRFCDFFTEESITNHLIVSFEKGSSHFTYLRGKRTCICADDEGGISTLTFHEVPFKNFFGHDQSFSYLDVAHASSEIKQIFLKLFLSLKVKPPQESHWQRLRRQKKILGNNLPLSFLSAMQALRQIEAVLGKARPNMFRRRRLRKVLAESASQSPDVFTAYVSRQLSEGSSLTAKQKLSLARRPEVLNSHLGGVHRALEKFKLDSGAEAADMRVFLGALKKNINKAQPMKSSYYKMLRGHSRTIARVGMLLENSEKKDDLATVKNYFTALDLLEKHKNSAALFKGFYQSARFCHEQLDSAQALKPQP